jgi:hypothetical protein
VTNHDITLLDTLGLNSRSSLEAFRAAVGVALASGARPFEVIAGAPYDRYGARMTFVPKTGDASRLGAAICGGHPWGPPTWLGIRWVDGRLAIKPYHRITHLPDTHSFAEVADDLVPQLAALDGDRIEVYLRSARERSWKTFVTESVAALCDAARARELAASASPLPRPAAWNHAVSYRYERGALRAISVFADGRALPAERTVRERWTAGLAADDAACFERLVAATSSYGRNRSGATCAMLAWSIDADGNEQRAVSLAIPVLPE